MYSCIPVQLESSDSANGVAHQISAAAPRSAAGRWFGQALTSEQLARIGGYMDVTASEDMPQWAWGLTYYGRTPVPDSVSQLPWDLGILDDFHGVLEAIAIGDATPAVRQFFVDSYVRGGLLTQDNVPFEGPTACVTKRRYRDRWNNSVLKRSAPARAEGESCLHRPRHPEPVPAPRSSGRDPTSRALPVCPNAASGGSVAG